MNNYNKVPSTPQAITDIVEQHAQQHPDKIAFRFLNDGETESGSLSYSQLFANAKTIAKHLKQHCGHGDRVLLLLPSGQAFIESFWACLFAGLVAVPAYPPRKNHNLERLNALVKDCQPRAIICDENLAKNELRELLPQISASASWLIHEEISRDAAPTLLGKTSATSTVSSEDLAFLQYTSGSTGNPKGVIISHGNILANVRMMEAAFHMDSSSVCVSWVPIFHDLGLIGCMLLPIYLGSTVVLMPPATFLQKPIRWLRAIGKYQGKVTAAPNFAYELLANSISATQRATLDLSSVELFACGAEPIRAETVSKFMRTFAECGLNPNSFYPAYGMAETTVFSCGGAWDKPPRQLPLDAQALEENIARSGTTGRLQTLVANGHAWGDEQVIICDPVTCEELLPGAVGEIWISGSHIAKGYWNKPQLTADTFNNFVANSHKGPFLRTGDLGCFIDGELYITGRAKDLIVIRGKNHYPQDIEHTVAASSELLQDDSCAAFSIPSDQGEVLVVLQEVKRSARKSIDCDAITQRIRENVAKHHDVQLHSIVLLNPHRLMKTSSGKIQRSACKQAYLSEQLSGVLYQWRNDASGVQLMASLPLPDNSNKDLPSCRLWLQTWIANRAQLQLEAVDLGQAITSYGLDSMDSFALLGDLSEWLEIHIDPETIWGVATVDELAVRALALLDSDYAQPPAVDEEISGTI